MQALPVGTTTLRSDRQSPSTETDFQHKDWMRLKIRSCKTTELSCKDAMFSQSTGKKGKVTQSRMHWAEHGRWRSRTWSRRGHWKKNNSISQLWQTRKTMRKESSICWEAAKKDEKYQNLVRYVNEERFDDKNAPVQVRQLKGMRKELSTDKELVLYGDLVIIPEGKRRELCWRSCMQHWNHTYERKRKEMCILARDFERDCSYDRNM